ncbi:hypothetical protein BDD43_3096 [Mucilaginibacter gracilis]|uniref:Uncharacterized protein n=1 Tax=Mucilaginibacter gracilis TaxID=423350 RepID=A0A495J263_9SPHI|nr:hypothetical protein BDD43_3096 [Mucilaginibacter gracilis]
MIFNRLEYSKRLFGYCENEQQEIANWKSVTLSTDFD